MNGIYSPALVFASYCMAVLASYVALDLGGRIAAFSGRRERLWLSVGALAMGTGIWSMHFVGMQAFRLPVDVSYDLWLTLLSWVAAVAVSLLALYLVSRGRQTAGGIGGGAAAMGAGICLMHYSGMWAMRMTPGIVYDPMLVFASAIIAMIAAATALFSCFAVRQVEGKHALRAKIVAALVMGAAVCGMHYTGMAAARFAIGAVCAPGNLLSGNWMGLPLALVAASLLLLILRLSVMDARALAGRRADAVARLERERLQHLAQHDVVTELPNRSLFNQTLLKQEIQGNGHMPGSYGLVYAELRSYRGLLEQLGQDRLNEVLKAAAAQLSAVLCEGDMLARVTQDGFVFLLRDRAERSVQAAMDQAEVQLGAALQLRDDQLQLRWGLGFSRFPEDGTSTAAMIRAAMKLRRETGGMAGGSAVPEQARASGREVAGSVA